jgi:hypothetical protein
LKPSQISFFKQQTIVLDIYMPMENSMKTKVDVRFPAVYLTSDAGDIQNLFTYQCCIVWATSLA